MPIIPAANGQAAIPYTRPAELRGVLPTPAPVPIASHAPELTEFVALVNAATVAPAMQAAFDSLLRNHVSATLADVPEERRAIWRTFLREFLPVTSRSNLAGPEHFQ